MNDEGSPDENEKQLRSIIKSRGRQKGFCLVTRTDKWAVSESSLNCVRAVSELVKSFHSHLISMFHSTRPNIFRLIRHFGKHSYYIKMISSKKREEMV